MRGKKLTARQLDTFLAALRRTGNVTLSAEAAGTSRAVVYLYRNATDEAGNPTPEAVDLVQRWDEAVAEANDRLEGEAWRRAFDGWDEPVFGRVGKDQDGEIGIIRKYDSGLLSLLLKAHKPEKYRERQSIDHTITTNPKDLSDAELEELLKKRGLL